MDRLQQVAFPDGSACVEIGDRARDLQDPVVGAGGEGQPLHRLLQEVTEGGG